MCRMTRPSMLPGDKISWNNSQLTKIKFDLDEVLAWKNEQMVFKNKHLKIFWMFSKNITVCI